MMIPFILCSENRINAKREIKTKQNKTKNEEGNEPSSSCYFSMQTEIVNLFRNYDAEEKKIRRFFPSFSSWISLFLSLCRCSLLTISHLISSSFEWFISFVYTPCANSWSVQQSNEKCIINKTQEHKFANLILNIRLTSSTRQYILHLFYNRQSTTGTEIVWI